VNEINRAILLTAVVALPCTALAQLELTQACDRSDMVHASVDNMRRGVRPFRWGAPRCPEIARSGLSSVRAMSLRSIFA
jgi:hypothetical protein